MRPNRRDVAILRFLRETGLALPPRVLWENMRLDNQAQFSYRTAKRRLSELDEAGMVFQPIAERPYYAISKEGKEYLDELDSYRRR